jgi:hypothetical protein
MMLLLRSRAAICATLQVFVPARTTGSPIVSPVVLQARRSWLPRTGLDRTPLAVAASSFPVARSGSWSLRIQECGLARRGGGRRRRGRRRSGGGLQATERRRPESGPHHSGRSGQERRRHLLSFLVLRQICLGVLQSCGARDGEPVARRLKANRDGRAKGFGRDSELLRADSVG